MIGVAANHAAKCNQRIEILRRRELREREAKRVAEQLRDNQFLESDFR